MHSNSVKFRPTFVLIALNIAFFVYTSLVGGSFLYTSYDVLLQFGQVNGLVLFSGYYYQLLSSMFVHARITHLVGNMLFLLIFGLRAEEMFSCTSAYFHSLWASLGRAGELFLCAGAYFHPLWASPGRAGELFLCVGM